MENSKKKFFSPSDAANNLLCTPKDLIELRENGVIKTYDNTCYWKGGLEGCFNLLYESKILLPSDNPILDPNIKYLIENVCGYKKENIDWLHKAILFKYTNINKVTIPSVVFCGAGVSGKGTLIKLLSTIYGKENVLENLSQRDLAGSFDVYKGDKLVVEFAEVSSNNTNSDLRILNKLKNLIYAEKIVINTKGVPQYESQNLAWFFISSNSYQPVRLDEKSKGNRRFSIISSGSKLQNTKEVYDSIEDKNIVSDYLAWLHLTYPEILYSNEFEALDNDDKKDLEDRSQNEANFFWEWFEEKYPDRKGKISKMEIEEEIKDFCFKNNIKDTEFMKFFWHNSKHSKKRIKLNGVNYYGVYIK